jgi:plasmid stability protein
MMNAITIRNLSDEVSRALEARAVENGTSAEFEAERILEDVLVPVTIPAQGASGKDLVEALQRLGKKYPELQEIDFSRDQTLARGVDFE